MTEQTIKRTLMDAIRHHLPQAVALRHEDRYTHGIPDLSLTLAGTTSWWEVKYADPGVRSKGIQQHLCKRLAVAGQCRYIIFQRGIAKGANRRPRQIRVVPPDLLDHWTRGGLVVEDGSFAVQRLVFHMAKIHGVRLADTRGVRL